MSSRLSQCIPGGVSSSDIQFKRYKLLLFTHVYYMEFVQNVLGGRILLGDSEARVRFPALPDFLRRSWSGAGSTQPREYN
jgi:hypothetical protein